MNYPNEDDVILTEKRESLKKEVVFRCYRKVRKKARDFSNDISDD